MRSLAFKLTLAFLFVAVTAIALVGIFVSVRTQNAYDRLVFEQSVASLASTLESYYQTNGSWVGVGSILEPNRAEDQQSQTLFSGLDLRRLSVAVLDQDRTLVFGMGQYRTPDQLSAQAVQAATPLTVDGQTVGWLAIGSEPPPPGDRGGPPEQAFVQRVTRAILYGALGAVALALALGVVLARTVAKPIRALTSATEAVAKGQLGKQVPVRSRDEIGQLTASFNQMSADLAHVSEARKQMTADIAHELRTPLSTVVVYAEGLKDGKLEGTPQIYAALYDTARHLQHLVDDLRTLALVDAGELSLNRRLVDPRALLERAILAHMVQAQAAGISLQIEGEEELPAVDADPERISQVLDNLVANALRHTPAGGQVVLSAEMAPQGHAVALRVADTGAGIAPEDLPFVFDRFYRGDKARQALHGESGLGLAIARSIVESHGGAIGVTSTVGSGTAVTMTLPAA